MVNNDNELDIDLNEETGNGNDIFNKNFENKHWEELHEDNQENYERMEKIK